MQAAIARRHTLALCKTAVETEPGSGKTEQSLFACLTSVIPNGGETSWPDPLDRLRAIYKENASGESASASEQIYQDRG
jgi:hypothetical protein